MTVAETKKRLAIVGCGSSGLASLKFALEFLPDWEIVAFEKTDSITGCWGNPYSGFVSTSTRYTTQFACFPKWRATVHPDGASRKEEFFRDGEFGEYLESFADEFQLRDHIRLHHRVDAMKRAETGGWNLTINGAVQHFDAVVICTGLAAKSKSIESHIPQMSARELNGTTGLEQIADKTIVVVGGGESAVDYANRLAKRELENTVYLSLQSGIRVSPRYHPVRGVPSDFLRNRLMLSADPATRNVLGQLFVLARIKYRTLFEKVFPPRKKRQTNEKPESGDRARHWAMQLTLAAKDDVFNMFHNKSDDFLRAVGEERIKIIGAPKDHSFTRFMPFGPSFDESDEEHLIEPDLVLPAIGYVSTIERLSDRSLSLPEFYLGCLHGEYEDIFLVGFARPVIGNIPSISEMQARYVCGLIAGKFKRPADIERRLQMEQDSIRSRYRMLNAKNVFPVEMFPYCNQLARLMGLPIGPPWRTSLSAWWKTQLEPATTMHYFHTTPRVAEHLEESRVCMPLTLVVLILFVKPFDWVFKAVKWWLGNLF